MQLHEKRLLLGYSCPCFFQNNVPRPYVYISIKIDDKHSLIHFFFIAIPKIALKSFRQTDSLGVVLICRFELHRTGIRYYQGNSEFSDDYVGSHYFIPKTNRDIYNKSNRDIYNVSCHLFRKVNRRITPILQIKNLQVCAKKVPKNITQE